jgi:periplasmic protein TonB
VSSLDVLTRLGQRRTALRMARSAWIALVTLLLCPALVAASDQHAGRNLGGDRLGVQVGVCVQLGFPGFLGRVGVDAAASLHLPLKGPLKRPRVCPPERPSPTPTKPPPSPSPSAPPSPSTPPPSAPVTPGPSPSSARPRPTATPTALRPSSASPQPTARPGPSAPPTSSAPAAGGAGSPGPSGAFRVPARQPPVAPARHGTSPLLLMVLVITVPAVLAAVVLRPRSRSSRSTGGS